MLKLSLSLSLMMLMCSGTDKEDRGLDLFGDIYNYCDEEKVVSTGLRGKEEDEVLQALEKYNLRKSLAWDKAFFTNAGKFFFSGFACVCLVVWGMLCVDESFLLKFFLGVLEPDELCHMIESNHVVGEKKVLPSIQEDVKRSTESISTLQSDCTVEASQDCVLFEDVRASIQRSSAVSTGDATPDDSKGMGEREALHSPSKFIYIYWQS